MRLTPEAQHDQAVAHEIMRHPYWQSILASEDQPSPEDRWRAWRDRVTEQDYLKLQLDRRL